MSPHPLRVTRLPHLLFYHPLQNSNPSGEPLQAPQLTCDLVRPSGNAPNKPQRMGMGIGTGNDISRQHSERVHTSTWIATPAPPPGFRIYGQASHHLIPCTANAKQRTSQTSRHSVGTESINQTDRSTHKTSFSASMTSDKYETGRL